MPGTHTPRQKRQAQHILISEKKAGRSKSKPEAERVAWAAVNKDKKPKKSRRARKAERVPFAKLSSGDQHRVPLVFDAPAAGKKHEHYSYPVDRKGKLREKGARELPGSPRIKVGDAQKSEESQKMSDDVYDDLLKSVDAPAADKVVISCPHCDEPITKSQILAKAKKAKGAMRGSVAHANTSPHDGGEPGTSVEPARPGAGALENDPGSPRITKAKKADGASCDADSDSDSMSKGLQSPRLVGGSTYVQYVDSGDDKFFADEIAKGLDRSAFVTKPMDNGRSPSRNRGG